MSILLNTATAKDVAHLLSLQKAAFEPLYEYYQDNHSPFLEREEDISRWIMHEKVSYFCIYEDGRLCGGIAILNKENGEYYLARLFVHPHFQGKGIAYQAILQAESRFPQAIKWSLDFPIDRIANKKTYEKAGYLDTGKREFINERLTLAIYEKFVSKEMI